MKTCPKCHIEKNESEFYKDRFRSGGLTVYCKSCISEKGKLRHKNMTPEQRSHYNEMWRRRYHGEYVRDKSEQKMSKSDIQAIRAAHGCLRCGESDPYALDFHHVGEKSHGISNGFNMTKKAIMSEISKCVVLCSNCHRKLHAELWSLLDFSAKIESDYPEAFDMLYKSVHPYH